MLPMKRKISGVCPEVGSVLAGENVAKNFYVKFKGREATSIPDKCHKTADGTFQRYFVRKSEEPFHKYKLCDDKFAFCPRARSRGVDSN